MAFLLAEYQRKKNDEQLIRTAAFLLQSFYYAEKSKNVAYEASSLVGDMWE